MSDLEWPLPPKTPTREEGGKSQVCIETVGRIVFKGDNSDSDNIEPDVVKHYYSMPDDMDINDTESDEPQADVEFPDAAEI